MVCFYGDLETNYRVIVAVEFCCTSEKLLVQILKNDLDLYNLIKFKINATAITLIDSRQEPLWAPGHVWWFFVIPGCVRRLLTR